MNGLPDSVLSMDWEQCAVCGMWYQGIHLCGGSPSAMGGVLTCPGCGLSHYAGLGHVCAWLSGTSWWTGTVSPAPLTADQVRQIIREEIEAARERDAK